MRIYSKNDLGSALVGAGLKPGDTVYIHSRLFSLGMMQEAGSKEDLCRLVVEALFEVLGSSGTLSFPAFTTFTQRYGVPFILEKTECMTGILPEYVRRLPGSQRSLHPTDSVVAVGAKSREICENVSASNYGADSPFDRMRDLDAKAINIGMSSLENSWFHYLEAVYGVPYRYNKILDVDVFAAGQKVERTFLSSVRYLDYPMEECLAPFDDALRQAGVVRLAPVGAGLISCVGVREYCQIGLGMLRHSPYAFLKEPPPFVRGKIPWDGVPGALDQLALDGYYAFLAQPPSSLG